MIVYFVLKLVLWEWLAAIISCCSKKKQIDDKIQGDSNFYDHCTNTQMVNELALYKCSPLSVPDDSKKENNNTLQAIKKVHADRLTKYQEMITADLGSKVHDTHQSNIGMSIFNNEKNLFVGVCSFDYRMAKDYKKYFYQTITAGEAINVKLIDDSGLINTKEIGIFCEKNSENVGLFDEVNKDNQNFEDGELIPDEQVEPKKNSEVQVDSLSPKKADNQVVGDIEEFDLN